MIKFSQADPVSILPPNIRDQTDALAIGYACKMAMKKMLEFMPKTSLYARLDKLDDPILDLLALEMRCQYYSRGLSIDKKRNLIRQAMKWHMRAGTPYTLAEFLATLYDGGTVSEWYDYGGEPYYFKVSVVVNEWEVNHEVAKDLKAQIEAYKNVRSWLDKLEYIMQFDYQVKIAYQNYLQVIGQFYPRYNLPFHHLEGEHLLSGNKYLNGYDTDAKVDFYPMSTMISGTALASPAADETLKVSSEAIVSITAAGEQSACSEVAENVEANTKLNITSTYRADPIFGSEITVEKNLRYLDGSGYLDGTDLLNAEIYTIKL